MDTTMLFYYLMGFGLIIIIFENEIWYIFKPRNREYTKEERDEFHLNALKVATILIICPIASLLIKNFIELEALKFYLYFLVNISIIGLAGFQMPSSKS